MNTRILERHLQNLSYVYVLRVSDDFSFFILRSFGLPPGYNKSAIDIWTEIPADYPESPVGVGNSRVYVPLGLKFRGRTPADYHESTGPEGWAWWCYEQIDWDPCQDDFITFFEIMRAHMTNPR